MNQTTSRLPTAAVLDAARMTLGSLRFQRAEYMLNYLRSESKKGFWEKPPSFEISKEMIIEHAKMSEDDLEESLSNIDKSTYSKINKLSWPVEDQIKWFKQTKFKIVTEIYELAQVTQTDTMFVTREDFQYIKEFYVKEEECQE